MRVALKGSLCCLWKMGWGEHELNLREPSGLANAVVPGKIYGGGEKVVEYRL